MSAGITASIRAAGREEPETMWGLGRKARVGLNTRLMDGINAACQIIPLCYFDAGRCAKGLEALREYKAEWDEDLRTFKKQPDGTIRIGNLESLEALPYGCCGGRRWPHTVSEAFGAVRHVASIKEVRRQHKKTYCVMHITL